MRYRHSVHLSTRAGGTLLMVMGLTTLGAMIASTVMWRTGTRVLHVRRQVSMEQAFYLAEAGAERAASRLAGGNTSSGVITGLLGAGSYEAHIHVTPKIGGAIIDIASTGTVHGVSRSVTMHGLRQVSWARYALFYQEESNTPLYITGGESFRGPVFSKPQLAFHSSNVQELGNAHFFDKAWSCADTIRREKSWVNPIFDIPVRLSAPNETMGTIDFGLLKAEATGADGLVFEGNTTIVVSGTQMYVTNAKLDKNNTITMSFPVGGLVYIQDTKNSSDGYLTISAPDGIAGRLTFVADRDINIADHIRYTENPETHPESTDALGLIAKRHVLVQKSASDDLEVYAHIICRDGGFGVYKHDKYGIRGTLNVYGGIVNKCRQAVGLVNGTGYKKNYTFDERFLKTPPPAYPVKTDEFEWSRWEG